MPVPKKSVHQYPIIEGTRSATPTETASISTLTVRLKAGVVTRLGALGGPKFGGAEQVFLNDFNDRP